MTTTKTSLADKVLIVCAVAMVALVAFGQLRPP